MRSYALLALAAAFVFSPHGSTEAGEGLFLSSPPAPVERAWNGTVLVSVKSGVGSAVLIRKEARGNRHLFFFLTAGHLRAGNEWPENKAVNPAAGLSSIEVFKNMRWQADSEEPAVYEKFPEKLVLVWGILTTNPIDAGLLVFEAKGDIPELVPLPLISERSRLKRGRKNYSVGFPSIHQRPVAAQKVAIEQPHLMTKRWSEGFLTGIENPETQLYGSTADSLRGQSGGPMVDEDGVVLGVLAVSNIIDHNGQRRTDYRGSDRQLRWYSAFYSYPQLPKYVQKQMKAFETYIQAD